MITVPLMEVILNSKFCSGKFLVWLIDTLHDSSFNGLIGNDLDPPRVPEDYEVVPVGALQQRQLILDGSNSVIVDRFFSKFINAD